MNSQISRYFRTYPLWIRSIPTIVGSLMKHLESWFHPNKYHRISPLLVEIIVGDVSHWIPSTDYWISLHEQNLYIPNWNINFPVRIPCLGCINPKNSWTNPMFLGYRLSYPASKRLPPVLSGQVAAAVPRGWMDGCLSLSVCLSIYLSACMYVCMYVRT